MKRVVNLLHRQAIKAKAEGLFFKVSTLYLFKNILSGQNGLPRDQPYKDLVSLLNFILRKFFKAVNEDSFLILEARRLSWISLTYTDFRFYRLSSRKMVTNGNNTQVGSLKKKRVQGEEEGKQNLREPPLQKSRLRKDTLGVRNWLLLLLVLLKRVKKSWLTGLRM